MLDWIACWLVRSVGWLLCRLPPAAAVRLGEALGALAAVAQPRRVRLGVRNAMAAFAGQLTSGQARRLVGACFGQMGAALAELLRLPAIDRAYVNRYITIRGFDRFTDAAGSGRPVVVLTGHYGNWELSSIVAALKGYPIIALARAQKGFPRLYRLLVAYRESKGCRIVHKGGAMRRLITALEERQLVGIVGDQASRQGLFVEFLGRPAQFATGPFELAWQRRALIVPAFIRRRRGPYHEITVEPPLELPRDRAKDEAIREAMERFARLLERHIREEPRQWLWMHNRWKRTPARRVLVLSDGKLGHLKQSLTVVDAIRAHAPATAHEVIAVAYRGGGARALAALGSWWGAGGWVAERLLRLALAPAAREALMRRGADLIVSCGAAAAPVSVLWARTVGARSIVIMNPAPVPLRRFDLVIAPRHDGLRPRANVLQTLGAVARLDEDVLREAAQRLQAHRAFKAGATDARPHPVIALFVGGSTEAYHLSEAFVEALVGQVTAACEAADGWCLATSSRRTPPAAERVLAERLSRHPRCRLLLLASRDSLDSTLEGMLGLADVAVVTGESVSMVSEACASGRRVVVVEPPVRAGQPLQTKHHRFLESLHEEGYIRLHPLPEISHAIQRELARREPARRLDDFAAVRGAVSKLL